MYNDPMTSRRFHFVFHPVLDSLDKYKILTWSQSPYWVMVKSVHHCNCSVTLYDDERNPKLYLVESEVPRVKSYLGLTKSREQPESQYIYMY